MIATGQLPMDALRALCAIAREGGVTRAATALGISQSAVSHRIRRLESDLGLALLSRRAGGPLLTDAGRRLLGYGERIVSLHDEALRALSVQPLTGVIRLGLTEEQSSQGLARVLGRFKRRCPQVTVQTHVAPSRVLNRQLEAGRADLVVLQCFRHEVRPTDHVLFTDTLHWVSGADFPPPELSPLPYVGHDSSCYHRNWADSVHPLQVVVECNSIAGLQDAIRHGLGASLLNRHNITPDMRILEGLPPPPDVACVVRRPDRLTTAQAALAQAIVEEEWYRSTVRAVA